MSMPLLRTGADVVRFGAAISIECRDCGSVVSFGPAEFAKDCGTGSLGGIAKHWVCGSCGEKRAQLMVLPLAPRASLPTSISF